MSEPLGEPGPGPEGLDIPERYGTPVDTDWKKISKFTLLGVLVLAAVTFIFSNQDQVDVSFLTISLTTSLFWALVLAMVLGLLIGAGGTLWWQRRSRRREERRGA